MSKSPALNASSTTEPSGDRFYRTVWRWHFYAGLFVIPFMLILATTGIIYLFKPQLDAAMYPHLLFVQPSSTVLPYTQQLTAVQQTYPDATVTQFVPQVAVDRSAEVTLTTAGERTLMVFVNPYTGEVLGDRDEANNLQAIARQIHGELMMGTWGDRLVELAACWALVLLISGLYLWFPRNQFSLFGTLIPRWWSGNQRIFWRDLHAVSGFYGVVLIGFLILTGLPWSGFWGETFAQISSHFPVQMWDDIPQSTVLTGSLNQSGAHIVPWAVEQLPIPQSQALTPAQAITPAQITAQTWHFYHAGHTSVAPTQEAAPVAVDLNSIVALAQAQGAPPGFSVSFPKSETGVYTVSAFPNDPTQEMTLHIDQYSGQVLADVRWQDYGLVPKAVEMGIAIHMGKFFGWGNQLLMLFACLVVILLCLTGAVMWWQRRPKSSGWLGAPPLPPYVQSWKVPLAIVAVLGIAFPLVGISLMGVLLLDYGVLSRIPALKRILS